MLYSASDARAQPIAHHGSPRMKVAILLTMLVGLALAVLAILQHVDGIITADHVAIAFGLIGLIVFALGAFMALVRNN